MSKRAKGWLIAIVSLILISGILFICIMVASNWDFTKLSTIKFETTTHKITDNYTNISIITDTADILFVPVQGDEGSIECFEQKNMKHSVTIQNGELVIDVVDTRKWYEYIGIHFKTPKITISIPQREYGILSIKSSTGDVEIPANFKFDGIDIFGSTGNVNSNASSSGSVRVKTSTGNIRLENTTATALDLCVSTGNISLSRITCEGDVKIEVSTGKTNITDTVCKNVISNGSTGNVLLNNVIASETYAIERSTGNVRLDGCDAAELFIKTDTGNVTGTLLSEKIFITETSSGRIRVPKTTTGGKCEIITSTGNIGIDIQH